MTADYKKSVYSSLRAIDEIHSEQAYKIISDNPEVKNAIATIVKANTQGFRCKITLDELEKPVGKHGDNHEGLFSEIILEKNDKKYILDNKSIRAVNTSLSVPVLIEMECVNFQSGLNKDFDNKLLRLIIPIEKEVDLSTMVCKKLQINNIVDGCGLIEAIIDDKNYHLFRYTNNDLKKNYLIIDSLEPNLLLDFKENSKAILLAFGLITGNLYQGEYYYLTNNVPETYGEPFVSYFKVEESIISNKALLNPFQFSSYLEDIGRTDILEGISPNMEINTFATLCKTMKKNPTYARCCLLLIEGHNSNFALLRAGIYSIALETLTSIIYEEKKEQINPIQDKKLASKIRDKILASIKEYDAFLTDYGRDILNAKINDINKPTNSKKLTVPFELYGIELTRGDKHILDHRNKFLHGSSPFKEEELSNKEDEINYITSKLLILVSCLMLKYVGYRGHIVNFPSFDQMYRKQVVTEHYFKLI